MMDILVDDIDRYEQLSNREDTNIKKNCHLLLEMYAILIMSIMAP
jgi:hypothetical protein